VQPVRAKAPDRQRVREHRGLDARKRRAPLVTRTLLGVSVVVLAAVAFAVASGGIGTVLGALAGGFGTAFGHLTATSSPSSTLLPLTDSPRIASPAQPYTNSSTVDLAISVPVDALGDPTAKVRIYLALQGLQAAPVVDVPIGTTARMVVPFTLTEGRNDISATLFRGGEESDQSPIVTYFLDLTNPKITITSPKNGAAIKDQQVQIKGTTQANTELVARNAANDTSVSSAADQNGAFQLALTLEPGQNAIEITGTDPAGNVGTTTLTVLQGSNDLTVRLSASTYRIKVSHPPAALQLSVIVTDPTGAPLAGATASFTLQIPGLNPISNELMTGPDGRAAFTTPLVGTLTPGGGIGIVLVSTDLYGQSTDRVTLTFVK
jgi:hypothetical protein